MAGRSTGGPNRRRLGQHFLDSPTLAARLVDDAGVGADDRVVEIGGGTGVLTAAIARSAGQLLTVELDPTLVRRLAARFESAHNVTVLHADAGAVPLPATPYRVVANLPFALTSVVLRRLLDDPAGALVRADLIVQWQVARHRVAVSIGPPLDVLGATWAPWWEFGRGRRMPAARFRPPPSVDAAVLTVTRRPSPLLRATDHKQYGALVRAGFGSATVQALVTSVGAHPAPGTLRALGIDPRGAPRDLPATHWVALFRALHPRGSRR